MKVAVVYCCPVAAHGPEHFDLACQFVASWLDHPPGLDHDFYVVSNGGPPDSNTRVLFAALNAQFMVHDDSGWDIGAFQHASLHAQCDLMVFLGGSTYVRGENWLVRAVAAFDKHGPGLYGCMGHAGDPRFDVKPHIRTTGFWIPPQLMNRYPVRIVTPEQRYPFEHGSDCLTQWVIRQGLKAWMVTWGGEYDSGWNMIRNGYHDGDQSELLLGDRLSAPPYHHCP